MHIPLSSPDITDLERQAVLEVLAGSTLSLGPKLPEFEAAAAQAAGVPFAVAVNSGTSALHLAVKAAKIRPGDEVITPSFSFIASTNCFLYEGGVPVFVDIDPATMNATPENIEAAITTKTKAILPVHAFGRPCRMREIMSIASKYNLTVIEDACEAIGAKSNGISAGAYGHSGVFAFYPNKQITTGEGGMLVTSDKTVADLCRSLRNQGRGPGQTWLQHDRLGYNYRLSDINCALGIAQLSRLREILGKRALVARRWDEALQEVPELIRPTLTEPHSEISWFVYVVLLPDEFGAEQRDFVLQKLRAAEIGCNNYFSPIHLQPYIRTAYGNRQCSLPVTESIAARSIALPFFNDLSEGQIGRVAERLKSILAQCTATVRKFVMR